MNQLELSSFKKRNASATAATDDDKKGEENVTETAAKKCKSENFNSNDAQYYFSNTNAVPTSASLHDGSTEFYRSHMNLIIRPNGCIGSLDCNANTSEPVHYSFQQVDGERTGDKQFVSRDVQTVKETNNSDSVLVTASGVSGTSRNYVNVDTSICNFTEQDSCERNSSSNSNVEDVDIRMTTDITLSTVNRPAAEFSKEHNGSSTITKVTKEVANSNQESDAQRYDSSISRPITTPIRSTTGSMEDSVEDLMESFRRLRICDSKNVETGISQYYVVAYTSEEGIQQCIITKKWRPENRKFVGKMWDLHSGTVYLFFTVYGTKRLFAVATLSPDQDHDSYIGVNFLRAINLPEHRYSNTFIETCKVREILPMSPDFGKVALEAFLGFEAELEDKSIVDDINEALLARLGQNVGLRNLGNTCYINCILQCLAKIPWKPPTGKNLNDELVTEFFRVMSWLLEPGGVADDSISPQQLRSQIARFSSRFASHQQQDAHELLLYLLGELNKRLKKNLSANGENSGNCVKDQFNGRLQNSVVFECGHNIYNDQPFFSVSLSIPENCRDTGSAASVSDCLELFLAEERMTGDNKAMCLECSGELKDCTLRTQFEQLPSILILHIQRTDFLRLGKLETEIAMPLRGLQMKELSGRMYDYDLFAICNHYGSLKCGHYTADVRCQRSNKWFTCSDSSVYEMHASTRQNLVEFRSNSASILFYARNSHRRDSLQYTSEMIYRPT